MSATTAILEKNVPLRRPSVRKGRQAATLISMQAFLEKFARREDGHKYEFENGHVIKSRRRMNDRQQHIANNLTDLFYRLKFQGILKGNLASEKDTHFGPLKMRVPDLCYMSPKDDYEAAHGGHPIPEFAIEIVSTHDTADYYDKKIDLYLETGVKVVWLLYPESEKVVVIAADGSSVAHRGEQVCSAAPALPEFALPARLVFQKPAAPGG